MSMRYSYIGAMQVRLWVTAQVGLCGLARPMNVAETTLVERGSRLIRLLRTRVPLRLVLYGTSASSSFTISRPE